jgi:predicted GTPase
MPCKRVIIMGAAGRDFHNFNMYYRDNKNYEVVAFTAAQIPNIENRRYPAKLAGKLYPRGIPIYPEEKLEQLIKRYKVDEVVFSYSDVSNQYVMDVASKVISAGASFKLMGLDQTMLESRIPVVAVVAARTGCGKSQTSRKVTRLLREMGLKVVVVRHPMPYGDLTKQVVQRFASIEDMHRQNCTIEEMEEYEPHIVNGGIVFAGVDYEKILREAEKEADVIVWDGGNNDMPFFRPNLTITVVDPHRPGHELTYYPGSSNVRIADVIVINKVDSAEPGNVEIVRRNVRRINPGAIIIEAASPIFVEDGSSIRGKRALAVEDGPTLTHGEMNYGAAVLAAKKFGASELVDPRDYAVGSIKEAFKKYTQIKNLLPALGYGRVQIKELEKTINRTPADVVIIGTPIDLRRVLKLNKLSVRVRYELQEIGKPDLQDILSDFVQRNVKK